MIGGTWKSRLKFKDILILLSLSSISIWSSNGYALTSDPDGNVGVPNGSQSITSFGKFGGEASNGHEIV